MTTSPRICLRFIPALRSALIVAAALALGGCSVFPKPQTDPTRHFVLNNPSSSEAELGLRTPDEAGLKIGLRTVRVSPYLEGKAMIVRRGDNEIEYLDYARWAEPLAVGVARVLDARLSASERVTRVLSQPFPFDVLRDIDLAITVQRCEGRVLEDGTRVANLVCTLEFTWAHEGAGSGEIILRDTFSASDQAWAKEDYAGLAAALSSSVSALADHVVARLPASVD